jgi:hypothetical protein
MDFFSTLERLKENATGTIFSVKDFSIEKI